MPTSLELCAGAGGQALGLERARFYHVGLRDHLEDFKAIRARYVKEPYPAWTAIEVSGFVNPGAFVEIRCIAHRQ